MGFWDTIWTDEWWLKYALDAIGGGVIGGLVTGGAVWATIRHERKMREADQANARQETLRTLVEGLRNNASELMLRLGRSVDDGELFLETQDRIGVLFSQLLGAEAFAARVAPHLAANLDVLSTALTRLPDLDDDLSAIEVVRNVCKKAVSHSWGWVADPEKYERARVPMTLEELLSSEEPQGPQGPSPAAEA